MMALFAALCAATKNEGWIVVFAVLILYPRRLRSLVIVALVAGPTLYLKHLAPPDTFLAGRGLESYWLTATEMHRYEVLGSALWVSATGRFLLPILGIMSAVLFSKRSGCNPPAGRTGVLHRERAPLFLLFVFLGLMVSLILSPFEITWQVSTTLDRLLIQVLPAAIYLAFRD